MQAFRRVLGITAVLLLSSAGRFGHAPLRAQAPEAQGVLVTRLETDAAATPLGIDARAPRLSWILTSERRGVLQTAFRVLVASRPELAVEGRANVWDSTRVASANPWIIYAGPPLASRTRYFWAVRVWAGPDLARDPAEPTWFETALLEDSDWRGRWIAGPERPGPLTKAQGDADDGRIRAAGEFCRPVGWLTSGWSAAAKKNNQGECRELRPAPLLRRAFTVSKPVARARLYASGVAYADLMLNGRSTSARELEPAFTNYSKTVDYTTDDVTSLLRPGENVIAAVLGWASTTMRRGRGTGDGRRRSGVARRGCGSTCTSPTRTAPRT